MSTNSAGCFDCTNCNDCDDTPVVDTTCSIKLDTSCILYNIVGGNPSLLIGLNLANGATLTAILEAIDNRLNSITGYNISTYNLHCLASEYALSDIKDVIEAITDKLCRTDNQISVIDNRIDTIENSLQLITQFIESPDFSFLYDIGIAEGDSLQTIIQHIVNKLGELIDNSFIGGSPALRTINTNTISFSTSGQLNHTLTANVVVAPDPTNLLKIRSNGLFVEPVNQLITFDPLTRKVCLSNNGGCFILPLSDTNFDETTLIGLNSSTVEIITSGTKGHTITANVNIQSILNQIIQSSTLKNLFCTVCQPDPCLNQNVSPQWTDTGETRCQPNTFTLEKKQKDNNICSPTYNTFRWIVAQTNSLLCGYENVVYCLSYNCTTTNCQTTQGEDCIDLQVCLRNQLTGQLIQAPEDIVIFYTYQIMGQSPSQQTFVINKGEVSGESICHCTVVDQPKGSITNIEVVGQESNNNDIGYSVCNTTPAPNPNLNAILLSSNCPDNTVTVSGTLAGINPKVINLYRDGGLVASKDSISTSQFSHIFTNIVSNGNYSAEILEVGNPNNSVMSTVILVNCATPPVVNPVTPVPSTIVLNSDCSLKTINTTGTLTGAATIRVELVRDGTIVDTKYDVAGPNFNVTFTNITTNGYYFVRALQDNNDNNKIASTIYNIVCFDTPVNPVNPPQNSIAISSSCDLQSIIVTGELPTATAVIVHLYKDNVLIQSDQDNIGSEFNVVFTGIANGTYYAKALEVNRDSNFINSSVESVNCVTNPEPPLPSNSINISGDCAAKKIAVDVRLNNNTALNLALYRNNELFDQQYDIVTSSIIFIFNSVNENGTYYVKAYESGNTANTITSSSVTFSCNVAPPPPPPPCTRPTGLTKYQNVINYTNTVTSNSQQFTSLNEACEKSNALFNGEIHSISSIPVEISSLAVGQLVYNGYNETNCAVVSAGFYYLTNENSGNTINRSIQIDETGAIVAIQTCTVPPPTPPPIVPNDGILNTGAVALNFIVDVRSNSTYEIQLKVLTTGLADSGATIKTSTTTTERMLGATTVANALAVMSATKSNGSPLAYYSAAISAIKLKEKYPNQSIIEFELSGKSNAGSVVRAVSRINVSNVESAGLIATTYSAATGLDYDYSNQTNRDSAGAFWYINSSSNPIPTTFTPYLKISLNLNTNKITYTLLTGHISDIFNDYYTNPQTITL